MAVLNSSTFYLHFWLKWLHSVCSDYIITAQIESQEEAKSSSVFFLQSAAKKLERGKKRGKKNDLKTEKTETGKPNFTNSQTDIGYMGEVGTGGVSCCAFQTRSRRQWWKQAWTVCCSSILLADKTTSRWRCQNIWVWHMAVLQVWHTHSSQLVCPEDKPFCDLGLMIWNCM